MNRQKWIILFIALALMGGTGATLSYLRKHQKLGLPGVKWSPIAGSPRLNLYLPERVLGYSSQVITSDTNLLNGLPPDTSFVQRVYLEPVTNLVQHRIDTNWVLMRIVLMGTDRTSIHKPEFCLTGIGFNIERKELDTVHVEGARPFDFEVMKLTATQATKIDGTNVVHHGIYLYWFVADNELTASHGTRMLKTATHLLKTGELQRWAYVSCFVVCQPGDENAASARVKKFIAASVPEFQLTPGARDAGAKLSQASSRPDAN